MLADAGIELQNVEYGQEAGKFYYITDQGRRIELGKDDTENIVFKELTPMSYDITFKVKVEGTDIYVPVGNCDANITWNVREIITKSTGLPWKNEANNGLCKDVIPAIMAGLTELEMNGEEYEQYEDPNGWGTVDSAKCFFRMVLEAWRELEEYAPELIDYTTFWIE